VWQSELNRTWQHLVCHHICNFIYYIWGAKCAVDCSLPLRFSNNSVCTSNDTLCHITQQSTSLPHIILITSGEMYKLWSYSSCCFIHFPFTFRCKSLNKLNSTIPIFSPHFFLKVPHQVSYTHIYKKILGKHAHFCISKVTLSDSKAKWYKDAVCNTANSFLLHFFILQSLLLTTPPKYLKIPHPFKMSNTELTGFRLWFFFMQIQWSNVAIHFLCSTDQTSYCHLIQLPISTHHTLSPDITASLTPQKWNFYVPVRSNFSTCPFQSMGNTKKYATSQTRICRKWF